MRPGFLLSIVLALHSAVGATADKERRSAPNGTPATILTPDIVEFVQGVVDTYKIKGLTMAIVHKTGRAEVGAWGIKSENGTKMTTDTLFNIASCSKAFLSASLGILIDDFAHGRNKTPLPAGLSSLTWRTKLADILPNDWDLMDPWASKKANLIDILSHVSGLPRHDSSFKPNYSVRDVTRNLRNLRPTFELREQWQYNNQMFMVGAYVVSTLSGMRFAEFVDCRIFKPLGMHSSTYSIDAAIRTGRFTSTWTYFGRLIPHWLEEEFVDLMAGPAGVISSVEELALWTRMFLNGGIDPATNVTIIPSAEFDTITSAHSIVIPGEATAQTSTGVYGLAWNRLSVLGHDTIWHDGASPGVTSGILAALEDGFGVVLLVNADSKATPLFDIAFKVALKAFGSANTSSSPPANLPTNSRRSTPLRHAGLEARGNSARSSDIDLAGTYYNPGYGALVLCNAHSTSPSCKSLLNDFHAVNKSLSPTDLFTCWPAVWMSHAQFTHTTAGQYLISTGVIYPEGYGKNTTPFSTLVPTTTAQFVVENGAVLGFGFDETDDSDVTYCDRTGSVEEAFQVWFAKQA